METNETMNEQYRNFVQSVEEGDQMIRNLEENRVELTDQMKLQLQAESEMESTSYMTRKLQESQKTFGDSKLMKAVKSGLSKVDDDILRLGAEVFTEEDFIRIRSDYFEAIESCRQYLDERDSSSGKGLERRRLVEHNYNRLIREAELVSQVEELKGAGLLLLPTDENITLKELLLRARVYDLGSARQERDAMPKEVTEVEDSPLALKLKSLTGPMDKKIKDKKKALVHGKDVGLLRRALKELTAGKASSSFVSLSDTKFIISQDENGVLTLKSGKENLVIRENVSDLLRSIDAKMIESSTIMNRDDLADMIRDQRDYSILIEPDGWYKEKSIADIQKAGTRLARFLELRTGKPATFFSNIDANNLRMLSLQLVLGASAGEIVKTVENIDKERSLEKKRINTSETLELLKAAEEKEEELEQRVILQAGPVPADGWTDEERATRDLVADMIFSQDTWEADETMAKPGERMRRMMLAHKDIIATLIVDNYREDQTSPSILDKVIDRLPLKMTGQNGAEIKTELKQRILRMNDLFDKKIDAKAGELKEFIGEESTEEIKKMAHTGTEALKRDREALLSAMDIALNPINEEQEKILYKELKGIEEEIDGLVVTYSKQIQSKIKDSVSEVFRPGDDIEVLDYLHQDPNEKGISKEEKKKRIDLGAKELQKTLTDSMQGESGQGKFIKNVFENYFKDADILDKRSMFGAAIRNAGADATPGQFLGGLLKGAGPLFQKMMQGLPAEGMPQDLQIALSDMKSKLAPIPERIVKAQLFGIVERSNGKIERIEVTRALGAASVGQAFMCKLYGPAYPEEGTDVVVKLLKPDVRNRMMREKSVMLSCARMTDDTGGMEATYLGQLSRIEEELDLTIEGRNIQKGAIYDKVRQGEEPGSVSSTKLVEVVDTTVNSLVMVKGPSTTVDRYIQETKERIASLEQVLERRDDEKPPKAVRRPIRDRYETEEKYNEALEKYNAFIKEFNKQTRKYRERIFREYKEHLAKLKGVIKTQKCLTELADKWVSEGIFGEGFYHGDLHAGNILTDENGITVIDFGNATTLTSEQQVQVTRMVGAAAVGDVDGFKEGLHKLLKPEFDRQFKRQEKKLTREIQTVFSLGDRNSAGLRIAVLLLKAQELGLEVPSSIFNFSQCQLRLQNTIDEMNSCIDDLKRGMGRFDSAVLGCRSFDMNMFDETLENIGINTGIPASHDAKELVKKHYYDNFDRSMKRISSADYRLSDEFIESGELYDSCFKKFVVGDKLTLDAIKQQYQDALNTIFLMIRVQKEKEKEGKNQQVDKEGWSALIQDALKPIEHHCDIEGIADRAAEFIEGIAKRKGDEEIPSDEDMRWLSKVEQKIDRTVGKFRNVVDLCQKLERDKKENPGDKELISADVEQIQESYRELYIAESMYSPEEVAYHPFKDLIANLVDPMKRLENDDMIEQLSEYDEELGKKLLDDYNALKKYQDANPQEIIAGSDEVEIVIRDIMKIVSERLKGFYEDYGEIADSEPKTFVDVMGDTIVRNLAESLKRLGFFTSISYNKKLNEE